MQVTTGLKCVVSAADELSFGMSSSDEYLRIPILSESLQDSFDFVEQTKAYHSGFKRVVSQGMISVNGSLITELSSSSYCFLLLKHLFGGPLSSDSLTLEAFPVTDPTAVTRGQIYTYSGHAYICTQSGSYSPPVSLLPYVEDQVLGTSRWRWFGDTSTEDFWAENFEGVSLDLQNSIPSYGLTIQKEFLGLSTPFYRRFTTCRVSTLTLSIPQESYVVCDWKLIGQNVEDSSSPFSFRVVDDVYQKPGFLGIDTLLSIGEFGGSEFPYPISSMTLTVDNNINQGDLRHNSRVLHGLNMGRREIQGNFTLLIEADVLLNWIKTQTALQMTLSFVTASQFFKLALQPVILHSYRTPPIQGRGLINASINFLVGCPDANQNLSTFSVVRHFSTRSPKTGPDVKYYVDEVPDKYEDESSDTYVTD